jgi:hypothetical protein
MALPTREIDMYEEPILDDAEVFFWSGAEQEMWDAARKDALQEYHELPQSEFADFMYDNLDDRYLDVQNQIEDAIRRNPSEVIWIADKLRDLFVETRAKQIVFAFYKKQGWAA